MRVVGLRLVLVLIAVVATRSDAATDDPAPDRVTLTDGTVVSGRILEESEKGVRIRTTEGEFLLPRKRIGKVERTSPRKEAPARGTDRLTLRSGEVIVGQIVSRTDKLVTIRVGETVREIPRKKIVEMPAPPAKPKKRPSAFPLLRDPRAGIESLTTALQLSKAQTPKVESALTELAAKADEILKSATGGGRDAAVKRLRELAGELHTRMKTILTDVQFAKFVKLAPVPKE